MVVPLQLEGLLEGRRHGQTTEGVAGTETQQEGGCGSAETDGHASVECCYQAPSA